MDFRQLEVFVSTVDHKSFSAAANALFISQPTVSAQIRALEQELHTELIKRTTKSFEVTADGQRLYTYAVSLLQLHHKAVHELDGRKRKELFIGASSLPGQCFLPQILTKYHQSFPDIHVTATFGDSMEIIQKVEDNTIDLGLVGTFVDNHCEFIPFAEDEAILIAPQTPYYMDLQKRNAPLTELLKNPFIMRPETSGTEQFYLRILEKIPVHPDNLSIVCQVSDAHALMNCVIQGLGISIVSRRMAELPLYQEKLLTFPLGPHAVTRNLYITFRKSAYLSAPLEHFIRFCQECTQEQGAAAAEESLVQ